MKISTKAWLNYINKMSKISNTAADLMQKWIQKNGFANDKALLDYAYALSAHYGEAIAELSCQMYEATASAQKASIPSAEPAEVPEYGEVAKAVHGTMKQSQSLVPSTIGRLVKQVGADTTLKNAIRDGAEFAWVPHGDTCAFCITLASRGWQDISKNTLKNGHAEHIHANCDCQYAVRFDGSSTVEGYDPNTYLDEYRKAGGDVNAMRRMRYAQNKDFINAQKRAAYAKAKTEKIRMDLQIFAKVPDEKLTRYALNPNHPIGKAKADAFRESLGYTQENYEDLKAKILECFNENELVYKQEDKYGKRYEQIMKITGPNGKTANVLTAWIKEDDDSEPRLTSVYVTRKEKT